MIFPPKLFMALALIYDLLHIYVWCVGVNPLPFLSSLPFFLSTFHPSFLPSFLLLHIDKQILQHHVLKQLFFPTEILTSLLKVNHRYMNFFFWLLNSAALIYNLSLCLYHTVLTTVRLCRFWNWKVWVLQYYS